MKKDPQDKLPPHSLEDERAVLSCVIQNPPESFDQCAKVTDESFYDLKHKILWRAICELRSVNETVDSFTMARKLKESGHEAIAYEYMPTLLDASPSAFNLPSYLPTLYDYQVKRKVLGGATKLVSLSQNGMGATELLGHVEKVLSIESPLTAEAFDGKSASLILIDDLERRNALHGQHSGLDTGIHELDNKLDGLQYGEQTLIGARPSKGKTALGLGVLHYAAFTKGIPSLIVSLEMSTASLMRRLMANHCEISMSEIRRGSYNEGDFKAFTVFQTVLRKAPIHIIDGVRGMTTQEICAQVRRMVRKYGIKLVVIDYLQKVRSDIRHEKRTYEVADVSGKLRALAVETKAAFLTLAQLNREGEKDKGRLPRVSDLGDSGQIERDADTIILIHRGTDGAKLIIGKQRDGETGFVEVEFNGKYCRFENKRFEPPPHYTNERT